jgi:hypothetical protein
VNILHERCCASWQVLSRHCAEPRHEPSALAAQCQRAGTGSGRIRARSHGFSPLSRPYRARTSVTTWRVPCSLTCEGES